MGKYLAYILCYITYSVHILLIVIVITIGYFGADVLCSDDNLFVAISNPTAYCEIYGEFHIFSNLPLQCFVGKDIYRVIGGFWGGARRGNAP